MADTELAARQQIKGIVAHLKELPTLPAVAIEVLNLSLDEFSDYGRIGRFVGADPGLAVKILKIANSSSFGAARNITSIDQALSILGTTTLKCALLGIMVRDTLFREDGTQEARHREVWRHCLACGVAAQLLAEARGDGRSGAPAAPVPKDEAFVAGLLHDVGRMILVSALPEAYGSIHSMSQAGAVSMCEAEERVLGLNHGLIGKWLAQKWNLPQRLIDAIWLHHHAAAVLPPLDGGEPLVMLVQLADHLAHGLLMDRRMPCLGERELPPLLDGLGLARQDVEAVAARLGKEFVARSRLFELQEDEASLYAESLQRANGRLSSLAMEIDRSREALAAANKLISMNGEAGLRLTRARGGQDVLSTVAELLRERLSIPSGLACRFIGAEARLEGVCWENGGLGPFSCPLDGQARPVLDGLAGNLPGFVRTLLASSPERVHCAVDGKGCLLAVRSTPYFSAPFASGEVKGEILFTAGGVSPEEHGGYVHLASLAAAALERMHFSEQYESRAEELSLALLKNQRINLQLLQAERLAAVGQLAAGAAHEINNPLAIIYARAQLLNLKEKDEAKKKVLQQMTGQIERISSILKNLMGFARPVPPKLEKLSVRTLLDKSLALIQGTFARDSIRLERDYQPDLPSIKGDASQLEGVFLNLLINAQHAMEGRGGVLRVEAKAGPDGKRIVVSIADQGIGIPEHNLAKIFDPFFTTKEEGKGTGLGLSTAYGIISNHDGTVTVRSKVGQGTTVTVELPADVDLPVADGPASRPVQDEPARTSGSILVVDDEVSILEILKEALEGEGFHVDTARNGQEGSERLRTASYRMVLLDIRMPLKTGLSLLADIKKAHPAMPVIVITGLASGEEMDKALALGAYKCIQKPFQIKPLLLDVHAALGAALGRAAKPARAGR